MKSPIVFALVSGLVTLVAGRTGPDVSDQVSMDAQDNIHISDGFVREEQGDIQAENALKASKDLSALQIRDPCAGIPCAANLQCPAGFTATKVEGHCCAYCVNPDIKLEAAVTGASGSSGGKPSTFC